MGKLKRSRKRLMNPFGILGRRDAKDEDIDNSIHIETGDVISVLEKLQSPSADDKECAAFTIANMASDAGFVASLIEKKVIRITGPLVIDKNPSIRHSILGCLRNLAVCGDYSICQAMVDQDIFSSLTALLMEYKQPWTPTKTEGGVIDSRSAIFLEACNLLWSLCESSDTAVTIFNEKKLIRILLPCLNIDVYGLQIPLAVAQCLNTVGEENAEVNEALTHPLIMEQLKGFMVITPVEPEHVLLKTLAASIMINILAGKVEHCMSDVTNPIGEVLHYTLSEPIQSALICLSQDITAHKHERLNKYRDEKDIEMKLDALNKTLKNVECLLEAKQISLEILANISTSYGCEEWEDSSGNGSSDDMEMEMEEEGELAVSPQKLELEMSSVIRDIILRYKLFDKVIEQIVLPEDDIFKLISENSQTRDILKRLSTVKCRALLCLNNMIQTIKIDDLNGPERVFQLWVNITNLLFKKTDISNTEELDATTSSMRAILQKLGEEKYCGQLGDLSEFDLELLINIYNQTEESSIKINIIRSLGTIGCLITNSQLLQSCNKHVKIIGEFLLDVCSKCLDLLVIAESLDSIFDVFAEDHVDYIAKEIRLLEKLKHLKKYLEPKWKQHRRSIGEESSVIKSARTNLRRFIDYKIKFYKK